MQGVLRIYQHSPLAAACPQELCIYIRTAPHCHVTIILMCIYIYIYIIYIYIYIYIYMYVCMYVYATSNIFMQLATYLITPFPVRTPYYSSTRSHQMYQVRSCGKPSVSRSKRRSSVNFLKHIRESFISRPYGMPLARIVCNEMNFVICMYIATMSFKHL